MGAEKIVLGSTFMCLLCSTVWTMLNARVDPLATFAVAAGVLSLDEEHGFLLMSDSKSTSSD
jgi:hypothetical protein